MQKPFLKAAVREFFHFNLADPRRFLLAAPLSIALLFQAALPAHGEGLQWSVLNTQVVSLYRQDRYQEAIPLAEEALALSVSSFGSEHPNVAIASNNLAALYHSLGQYDQAELFYNQALSIDQEVYGENHPHVAADRKNLKTLYRDHGRPLAVVGSGAASASRSRTQGKTDADRQPPSEVKPQKADPDPGDQPAPVWGDDRGTEDLDGAFWKMAALKPPSEGFVPEEAFWQEEESSWFEAIFSAKGGYRQDDFNWTIAGNIGGQSPNILSELTWTDLESKYIRADVWLIAKRFLAVHGYADYGFIYNGENQDSDFAGNNRTFEFSRSNNAADKGHLTDASIGLGYPWILKAGEYRFRIVPLAGFSFHEQKLSITNGSQTIPDTGPFVNLDSQYLARWYGPWMGLDLSLHLTEKVEFFGGAEYHWANYEANANWNLRGDFSHPKSFRHLADGQGWVTRFGFGYSPWEDWMIHLSMDFQDWSTDPGISRTFFSNGVVSETRLNQVDWDSFAVSFGLEAKF